MLLHEKRHSISSSNEIKKKNKPRFIHFIYRYMYDVIYVVHLYFERLIDFVEGITSTLTIIYERNKEQELMRNVINIK